MAHFSLGLVDTFWSSILGFEVVGLEVGLQRRMKKIIENVFNEKKEDEKMQLPQF